MASTPPKIDKELRFASLLGKMAMRPPLFSFKLFNWLSDRQIGRGPKDLSYEQITIERPSDGTPMRVCIYRPLDYDPDERLPAILYLHGGGYAMGVPESTVMPISPFFKARR